MDVLFLDAPFAGKVELSIKALDYLKKKKYKTVGLYASVQFCNNLDLIKKQLEHINVNWVSSKPDRTHVKSQLLGCDVYHDSLYLPENVDCYLYMGDGKFHPLALAYLQKDLSKDMIKEILCNDPMTNSFSLMNISEIKNILKKYKGSLLKFLSAQRVGVIATVKPGQEQLRPAFFLEQKFPQKKFYFFLDDSVSFSQLENFPFIEVWVNTACPRVGFDDQEKFRKGVINLNDALRAEEIVSKDSVMNDL